MAGGKVSLRDINLLLAAFPSPVLSPSAPQREGGEEAADAAAAAVLLRRTLCPPRL